MCTDRKLDSLALDGISDRGIRIGLNWDTNQNPKVGPYFIRFLYKKMECSTFEIFTYYDEKKTENSHLNCRFSTFFTQLEEILSYNLILQAYKKILYEDKFRSAVHR